ncbi:MAG: hypothetical protein QM820_33565 [Minicystis sp.]
MKRVLVGISCLLLSACAPTAHERFGDVARYAPRHAGYVVGDDDDPVILRDPVTAEKIRCRADLERVAPALADSLEDAARDRHARTVSQVALGPFTLAGKAAGMVAAGLLYPVLKFDEIFASAQPRQIYVKAREAFLAKRFAEARALFLTLIINKGHGDAIIDDLPPAFVEHSLYYVAVCDEALQRDEEAKEAFRQFLSMSAAPNEERYRDAEARLARLEGKPGCASRSDFLFTWRRSP